jgi:hypothetical protein
VNRLQKSLRFVAKTTICSDGAELSCVALTEARRFARRAEAIRRLVELGLLRARR